jgi:hypothetical protein
MKYNAFGVSARARWLLLRFAMREVDRAAWERGQR